MNIGLEVFAGFYFRYLTDIPHLIPRSSRLRRSHSLCGCADRGVPAGGAILAPCLMLCLAFPVGWYLTFCSVSSHLHEFRGQHKEGEHCLSRARTGQTARLRAPWERPQSWMRSDTDLPCQ